MFAWIVAVALQLLSTAPRPGPVILLGAQARAEVVPELSREHVESLVLELGTQTGDATPALRRIDPRETFAGDSRSLVHAVRSARHIELGAGSLVAWLDVLYPRRKPSGLVDALIEAHASGATIVARGERAGLISRSLVVAHLSMLEGSHADPHDAEKPISAWPLGFQPWALFDEETRADGSLLNWLTVMQRETHRMGVFLAGEGALVVDRANDTLTAHGPAVSLFVDAVRARRDEGRLRGVRLTMLADGDAWSPRARDDRARRERRATATADAASDELAGGQLRLAELVNALATAPAETSALTLTAADGTIVVIRVDEDTTVTTDERGRRRWADLEATFDWRATLAR